MQPYKEPGVARFPDETDLEWLKRSVGEVLARNRTSRRDAAGREWVYHAPSLVRDPGLLFRPRYPHQWFWDSCAHAVALSHIDANLSRMEIRSLLAAQDSVGFIPHQIFNPARASLLDRVAVRSFPSGAATPYLQPPVLAEAVQAACLAGEDKGFLQEVLPAVKSYYKYIECTRSKSDGCLVEIIHSYESGKDRSREYDEIYGSPTGFGLKLLPIARLIRQHKALDWQIDRIVQTNMFRVKDLLFNCVYASNLGVLAELCRAADEQNEGDAFASLAIRVEALILDKMYDPETGLFYSLDARWNGDKQIKVNTFSTFLPLLLNTISEGQVQRLVEEHMANTLRYWLPYPIPAEPLGSPEAGWRNTAIWRGLQTWVYLNWFIMKGLIKQSHRFPHRGRRYSELACELAEKTCLMVRRSGFREYYDSRTGRGKRARSFGMATLVLDMAYRAAEASI
ncbi:MAG: hypothetical protein HYX87_09560 [Chloroflexi bacterium]|nr:hypothetical protein [Chloroflexota bacterium]